MYQPKDIWLVSFGTLDHGSLPRALNKFEETILDDVPKLNDPFTRPWIGSESWPSLNGALVEKVSFPDEDQPTGETEIDLLGSRHDDRVTCTAIDVV